METVFTPDEMRAVRDIVLCALAVLAGFGIGYGLGTQAKKPKSV